MYTLIFSSDSPPGGGRTAPRTMSWTALREDPPETRTKTRTVLREDTRTAPRAEDQNYDLSTGLHTYGVSYPAGLCRPELVPAGTQTALRLYETLFVGGREEAR